MIQRTLPSVVDRFRPEDRLLLGALVFGLAGAALVIHPALPVSPDALRTFKTLPLVASALVVLAMFMRRVPVLTLGRVDVLVLLYFACGCLSWALHGRLWSRGAGWLAFEASGVVLALGASHIARTKHGRDRLLFLMSVVAAIVSTIAVAEALGVEFPWGVARRRPGSTLVNRNFVAAFAGVGAILAVPRLLATAAPRDGALVVLSTIAVVLSRCRSVWLGSMVVLACALVVGLVQRRGRRETVPAQANPHGRLAVLGSFAIGIGVASVVAWPGLVWTDKRPLLSSLRRLAEYESGTGRSVLDQHRIGWQAILDKPLLGAGPRQWDDAASLHTHAAGIHAKPWSVEPTPHSDLLRIAVEMGVPAALALVAAVVVVLVLGCRAAVRETDATLAATTAALGLLAVHSLFDAPLFRPEALAAGAMLIGILRCSDRVVFALDRRPLTRIASAVVAFGIVIVITRRVAAATLIAANPNSSAAQEAAQRWFPQVDVEEALARAGTPPDCALPHIERALSFSPRRWGTLELAGRCAAARGDRLGAEKYLWSAIEIEPHDPGLQEQLRALSGLGPGTE